MPAAHLLPSTPSDTRPATPTSRRRGWVVLGFVCIALGTLGIVLPLVPTLDFYGLAAICFARGSAKWSAWLETHPRIGPWLHQWRQQRAIPTGACIVASASLGASALWATLTLPAWAAAAVVVLCIGVASYLWTRPHARPAP